MRSKGMICFDMDGTIADLYHVEGWVDYIDSGDVYPYVVARPMWDMEKLADVLNRLIDKGWEIRVISWLSKTGTPAYNKAVRAVKTWWLDYHGFPYKKAHLVQYGTTKADTIRHIAERGKAILIDDNAKVREGWHMGETIDPADGDLIEHLEALLEEN